MRNLSQGIEGVRRTSPLAGFSDDDILRVSSEVTITTKTSEDLVYNISKVTKMAPTT